MSPVHDPRFSSAQRRSAEAARVAREERNQIILPIVLIAIGWILAVVIPLLGGGDDDGGVLIKTVVFAIVVAISVPAGLVGLVLAASLFGDSAGNLWMALLRLAACYCLTFGIGTALPLGPAFIFLGMAIMGALVAWLFEWELAQGAVVAVVCWILGLVIYFLLLSIVVQTG